MLLPSLASALEPCQGESCAANGGPLPYRESHRRHDENRFAVDLLIYRCPRGVALARKRIHVNSDAQAPEFELRDAPSGYVKVVRGKNGARQRFMRPSDTVIERSATIRSDGYSIADAGFEAFVHNHWDALHSSPARGSCVVPSRLEAILPQGHHVGDERVGVPTAQGFRLSVASWYGGLLPHTAAATAMPLTGTRPLS